MKDEIKIRTIEQQAMDNLKAIINCEDKIIELEPPLEETCQIALDYITNLQQENERLNNIIENIDTYIHLWKLEEIGEKTMLILNDILLIKNGMSDEVVRLKEVIKSE